ncbi:hypothetical protein YC2023_082618 [Brassica napus]
MRPLNIKNNIPTSGTSLPTNWMANCHGTNMIFILPPRKCHLNNPENRCSDCYYYKQMELLGVGFTVTNKCLHSSTITQFSQFHKFGNTPIAEGISGKAHVWTVNGNSNKISFYVFSVAHIPEAAPEPDPKNLN